MIEGKNGDRDRDSKESNSSDCLCDTFHQMVAELMFFIE